MAIPARAGLIGAAMAANIACTVGLTNPSFGAAIVSEARQITVKPPANADIEAMKAGYRRPAFIPFPEENPYTLAKAALGKKLYFDPRLSAASAQSCANCHNPGFGWGDGLALGVGDRMAKLDRRIATFERTVVSERSPFDAWVDGDERAIPEAAKHGFVIFNTKGQCSRCDEGWNFTNDGFHDIGLRSFDGGRAAQLPAIAKMLHAFKTPGLREIERRGPYLHDGSTATLEGVVEHYNDGGADRPSRSMRIGPLGLTPQDKSDLVAFLKTLTSNPSPTTASTDVTFPDAGEVQVFCAIHPRMKMTVKILE